MAAATGRVTNIKKGQFPSPPDMGHVVAKVTKSGNPNVLVSERGACLGYNTLISDMRALPIMKRLGCPAVFDATHSVQKPGGIGAASGGEREFVPILARAAVATGIAATFIESHEEPDHAPSNGPNMLPLDDMERCLRILMGFDALAKGLADATTDRESRNGIERVQPAPDMGRGPRRSGRNKETA